MGLSELEILEKDFWPERIPSPPKNVPLEEENPFERFFVEQISGEVSRSLSEEE